MDEPIEVYIESMSLHSYPDEPIQAEVQLRVPGWTSINRLLIKYREGRKVRLQILEDEG